MRWMSELRARARGTGRLGARAWLLCLALGGGAWMAMVTSTAASGPQTLSTCNSTSLAAAIAEAQGAGGDGVVRFDCTGEIQVGPSPIVVGASEHLTLDASGAPETGVVTLSGDGSNRVLEVRGGGSLTLIDLDIEGGEARGSSGAEGKSGTNGAAGAYGMAGSGGLEGATPGGAGGVGQPGTSGEPGDAGTDGTDGTSGGEAQGGGMFIAAGGTATVQGGAFISDGALGGGGGRGGTAGSGGPGGGGGAGGDGGMGGPGVAGPAGAGGEGAIGGDGASGGDGGKAGDGGDGGEAQGGAIYNEGSLAVTDTEFNEDLAYGGSGGLGGFGGSGGYGGENQQFSLVGGFGDGGSGGTGNYSGGRASGGPGGNGAVGGNGGEAADGSDGGGGGDGGDGRGGAIYNAGSATLTYNRAPIETAWFDGDEAYGGGGGGGEDGAGGGKGGNGGGGGDGGGGSAGGTEVPGGNGGNAAEGATAGAGGSGGDGGDGGSGGVAQGGGVYNTGSLQIDVSISPAEGRMFSATRAGGGGGADGGEGLGGGEGGDGGWGGVRGTGGAGSTGIAGGDGDNARGGDAADGGDGGRGGDAGEGGAASGGAVCSEVAFAQSGLEGQYGEDVGTSGGEGGEGGAGGEAGRGGTGGLGGGQTENNGTGGEAKPNGKDGEEGSPGAEGTDGAPGLGSDPQVCATTVVVVEPPPQLNGGTSTTQLNGGIGTTVTPPLNGLKPETPKLDPRGLKSSHKPTLRVELRTSVKLLKQDYKPYTFQALVWKVRGAAVTCGSYLQEYYELTKTAREILEIEAEPESGGIATIPLLIDALPDVLQNAWRIYSHSSDLKALVKEVNKGYELGKAPFDIKDLGERGVECLRQLTEIKDAYKAWKDPPAPAYSSVAIPLAAEGLTKQSLCTGVNVAILPICERLSEADARMAAEDEQEWPLADAALSTVDRLSAARRANSVPGMVLQSTILAALASEQYVAQSSDAEAGTAFADAISPYVSVTGTAAFAGYGRTATLAILSEMGVTKAQILSAAGSELNGKAFDLLATLSSHPNLDGAVSAANTLTGYGLSTLLTGLAHQGAISHATATELGADLSAAEKATQPAPAMQALLAAAARVPGPTGALITAAAEQLAS